MRDDPNFPRQGKTRVSNFLIGELSGPRVSIPLAELKEIVDDLVVKRPGQSILLDLYNDEIEAKTSYFSLETDEEYSERLSREYTSIKIRKANLEKQLADLNRILKEKNNEG